jgi:hypothetical protein
MSQDDFDTYSEPLAEDRGYYCLLKEGRRARESEERLVKALQAFVVDAMEFEGKLEAHTYVSVDALKEAREALAASGVK